MKRVFKKLLNITSCFLQSNKQLSEPPLYIEVTDDEKCVKDLDMPFEILNPMQSSFRNNYRPDRNCVVESGTGTGKTVLAYIASRYYLDQGKRVIITAPTRELVKQLYREALLIWGAGVVGLYTAKSGDISDKFFIVATPEGYISAVRSNKEWPKAGLLIVDEAHNIIDIHKVTNTNEFETTRGGFLDTTITWHVKNGGRVLLMSGTFPNKEAIANHLNADLFVSKYCKTIIHKNEVHAPDDFNAKPATKNTPVNVATTLSGHIFNREAVRLKILKDLLAKHKDESVIVFVPTKAIGFCLSEALVCPFHCADIEEKEKKRLVNEFNGGIIKTILATTTLAQGINTPADVVIIFGTRSGKNYLDKTQIDQMFGRAGRGKPEATVYLIGDKIEIFNAKKLMLARSLPLPVETMILTVLSIFESTKADLVDSISKTFAAATFSDRNKIIEAVDRYVKFLTASHIAEDIGNSKYALTKEGTLLAWYVISPKSYIKHMSFARLITNMKELSDIDKGFILLSTIIEMGNPPEVPSRIIKDIDIPLCDIQNLDVQERQVMSKRSAYLKYLTIKPNMMPDYMMALLSRDAGRWISMFHDMIKYGVKKDVPGLNFIELGLKKLKTAHASIKKRRKSDKEVEGKINPEIHQLSFRD